MWVGAQSRSAFPSAQHLTLSDSTSQVMAAEPAALPASSQTVDQHVTCAERLATRQRGERGSTPKPTQADSEAHNGYPSRSRSEEAEDASTWRTGLLFAKGGTNRHRT